MKVFFWFSDAGDRNQTRRAWRSTRHAAPTVSTLYVSRVPSSSDPCHAPYTARRLAGFTERESGEEGKNNGKVSAAGGKAGVAGREDDERERKRMLEDIGGDSGGTMGTKEQVDTLLKKLRGSPKSN